MQPLEAAAIRASISAVVVAGSAFFTALGQGVPLRQAGIAAGAAFFAVLVVRLGGEGILDQVTAPKPASPAPSALSTQQPPAPLPPQPDSPQGML